jgi:hypothetical protein
VFLLPGAFEPVTVNTDKRSIPVPNEEFQLGRKKGRG